MEAPFTSPSVGPNGVAYGYDKLFGATETSAFALDPTDGHVLWTRKLTRNAKEGIDMAPTVFNDTVLVSTIPGTPSRSTPATATESSTPSTRRPGKTKWSFDTISDGARLWGNAKVNSGGGLWYPPAVDANGRVFLAVANPAPFPGTSRYPNGSSRPGPDLYTDSLVALDGSTGKLLWYRQVISHDVRDYDLEDSPVIGTIPIDGMPTEVVFAAGKMGRVYAFIAADGKQLWQRPVGTHLHDTGLLPAKKSTLVLPGTLGGVETPMAYDGTLALRPRREPELHFHAVQLEAGRKDRVRRWHRRARGTEPVERLRPVAAQVPERGLRPLSRWARCRGRQQDQRRLRVLPQADRAAQRPHTRDLRASYL